MSALGVAIIKPRHIGTLERHRARLVSAACVIAERPVVLAAKIQLAETS